jgi:hypothetical protein
VPPLSPSASIGALESITVAANMHKRLRLFHDTPGYEKGFFSPPGGKLCGNGDGRTPSAIVARRVRLGTLGDADITANIFLFFCMDVAISWIR